MSTCIGTRTLPTCTTCTSTECNQSTSAAARPLRVAHERHECDGDQGRHNGDEVEGRCIAQPADQEAGDDRSGCLADVPDGSEHAHRGAEIAGGGNVGDQGVAHRRDGTDAEPEKRCGEEEDRPALGSKDEWERRGTKQEARQSRIAVAARKLGLIEADIAIALSMSVTHKNVGFDNQTPEVDFEAPELAALPGTGALPVKRADKRWSHLPHLEAEE